MKQTLLGAGAALCLLSFGSPAVAAGADDLVAAAKKEGALTVIALPRDWCGYGALIDSFKAKYGVAVNELNPDGGSGDEVEAIKANKGNKGPQAPDVIDVGLSFGPTAKAEGLLHGRRRRSGRRRDPCRAGAAARPRRHRGGKSGRNEVARATTRGAAPRPACKRRQRPNRRGRGRDLPWCNRSTARAPRPGYAPGRRVQSKRRLVPRARRSGHGELQPGGSYRARPSVRSQFAFADNPVGMARKGIPPCEDDPADGGIAQIAVIRRLIGEREEATLSSPPEQSQPGRRRSQVFRSVPSVDLSCISSVAKSTAAQVRRQAPCLCCG